MLIVLIATVTILCILPTSSDEREVFVVEVIHCWVVIDDTNQEGRTRSGYQHECQSRPERRPRRGAGGSGLTQVLIQTRVHSLEVGIAFIIS